MYATVEDTGRILGVEGKPIRRGGTSGAHGPKIVRRGPCGGGGAAERPAQRAYAGPSSECIVGRLLHNLDGLVWVVYPRGVEPRLGLLH